MPTTHAPRRTRTVLARALTALAALCTVLGATVVAGTLGAAPAGAARARPASSGAPDLDVKPPIPTDGVYLGGWVDPNLREESQPDSTLSELAQMPEFQAAIGRPLAIVHTYQSWLLHVQNQTLSALAANGAIPIIDWACGDYDANIIAGRDDAMISAFAQQLAQYGRPVFLRWYWEPNLHNNNYTSCIGGLGPQGYAQAWQHIWTLFQEAGATNVAFVWCPGISGTQSGLGAFYPGSQYVDWIGVDGYDRTHAGSTVFASNFGAFYAKWSLKGLPMMIAETGATNDQASYLAGVEADLASQFPDIKAFLYFDGRSHSNWSLEYGSGSTGLAQFTQMANTPYFSAMPGLPT